jgi:hypothetical protein
MRSVRRFMAVAASVVALAIIGSTAYGASPNPDAWSPISLSKECSAFGGKVGDHCTITASDLKQIPVGSVAIYYGPVLGPAIISSSVVLDAGNGNTASGYCNVDLSGAPVGMCAFVAGSGSLAGFQSILKVTVGPDGTWHWDGTYHLPAGA